MHLQESSVFLKAIYPHGFHLEVAIYFHVENTSVAVSHNLDGYRDFFVVQILQKLLKKNPTLYTK